VVRSVKERTRCLKESYVENIKASERERERERDKEKARENLVLRSFIIFIFMRFISFIKYWRMS